ncbi:MAG TPA: ABC transporter permease [Chthoniobacteraceae bacterium]|nr:ABC transporter permease [Chthoniobacteraceae bacterium]
MFVYLIRRLLYMIPILLGVMIFTFLLFNIVNKPEQMALNILGPKASPQAIENWLHNRGYDKPLFLNREPGKNLLDSQFFDSLRRMAVFDLGVSDATGEPVVNMLRRGILPSLLITLPAFAVGLTLALGLSLLLVFVRDSKIDLWGVILAVATMSIPITVYVIFGQWVAANLFNYFPAFGFDFEGFSTVRFIALPVVIMVISGIGGDLRLYRTIFLEEVRADYIRTAQAKGASSARVLLVHVLKNGMISIITLVVASLPFLIMGTLVIENFFGIPGLGSMVVDAITTSDFSLIRANVYVGSLLFLFGLLLTDLCYALADPRIRLE